MSFGEKIVKVVDEAVESFINTVAKKFELDKDELRTLWDKNAKNKAVSSKKTLVDELTAVDVDDLTPERLGKCNKAELVALCKSKGVKCGGRKDELIDRLLGKESTSKKTPVKKTKKKVESEEHSDKEEESEEEQSDDEDKKPKGKKKSPEKKSERAKATTAVLKKLTSNILDTPLRKNKHGNLEHPPTGLVFNKDKKAIGMQDDDGSILDLTDDDIQLCKKYKFKFIVPKNLDDKDANVKIDGIDSDEEVLQVKETELSEAEIEEDEDDDEEVVVVEDD